MNAILDWFFPPICSICSVNANSTICRDCLLELPWLENPCITCAKPLSQNYLEQCGECLIAPPSINYCVVLFRYEPPISSLITRLKFNHALHFAKPLGNLLADTIIKRYANNRSSLPECILPTPLSRSRIRTRGYNQAMEIARYIKLQTKIAIDYKTLIKIKETPPQTLVSRQERERNVADAFAINKQIPYKHVAVIDDVITTFSTLNSITHLLKQSGVQCIDVWCIAKASR